MSAPAFFAILAAIAAWKLTGERAIPTIGRRQRLAALCPRGLSPRRWKKPAVLQGRIDGWLLEVTLVDVLRPGERSEIEALRVALEPGGRWPSLNLAGAWVETARQPAASTRMLRSITVDTINRLAIFDPITTRAFDEWRRSHRDHDVSFEDGALVVRVAARDWHVARLAKLLQRVVLLADRLDRGGRSIGACLADGIEGAPAPERRERLEFLVQRFAGDSAALEACRRWRDDEDPRVRLAAATGLGAEGRAALEALALSEGVASEIRIDAVEAWAWTEPEHEPARAFIQALLRSRVSAVRIAALAATRRLDLPCDLALLLALLPSADVDESAQIAACLGSHEGPESEAALVRLLGIEEGRVRRDVLGALARVGTMQSVPALVKLSRRRGGPKDARQRVRATLDAIRSRLGPAESGRLALVEGDGSLSAAEGAEGALADPE